MGDESTAWLVWRQWCQEFAQWERTWTRERRAATSMPPVPAICRTFMCGAGPARVSPVSGAMCTTAQAAAVGSMVAVRQAQRRPQKIVRLSKRQT